MSAEEDTELRDLVAQTLEANGVLGKIRVRSFPVPFCGCTVYWSLIDQYKCRVRLISLLANIRRLTGCHEIPHRAHRVHRAEI